MWGLIPLIYRSSLVQLDILRWDCIVIARETQGRGSVNRSKIGNRIISPSPKNKVPPRFLDLARKNLRNFSSRSSTRVFSKRWKTTAETVSGTVAAHLCTVATRIVIPVFYCNSWKRGKGEKRKQGSDTLGNVAIALVFIVIGKITFIELDAYPRTMKWKKGGKIGHDTSFETTPQFSFARNFIVYICIYKLKRITTPMINSCYFPEDEDHIPLIERWFKFLKILGK